MSLFPVAPVSARRRGLLALAGLLPFTPALAADERPLQIVGPWEITGLQPAQSGFVFSRLQVAETLVGADDRGALRPALAVRWQAAADGLTWRFELRPGARFHDGSPVNAAAVLRSLQPARVAPGLLSNAPILAMETEGDTTLRIRLKERHAALPALLAHPSTLVLAPAAFDAAGRVQALIGSGPYRLTRLQPPQQAETVVFEGWNGGPLPQIRRVAYLAAGRAETRALMIESGQADLAYGLDPASLQRLRQRPALRVQSVMLPRTVFLKLNAGLPALADVRVRRALSLLGDRAGIARALLRDPALAATQLLPPSLGDWHDPSLAPLRHDPAAAQQLLAQAGWRRGADGRLQDARGQALALQLRTFPDRPELPPLATALQAQWRQAGIALEVAVGNAGDIPLGHRDGRLQIGLGARNYASTPDPVGTLRQDFGPGGGDWGAMGWQHADVGIALDTLARLGPEAPRAAELRRRVVAVLQDELPVIPVSWYRQQLAVGARVDGVMLDPLELSYRLDAMRWQA